MLVVAPELPAKDLMDLDQLVAALDIRIVALAFGGGDAGGTANRSPHGKARAGYGRYQAIEV